MMTRHILDIYYSCKHGYVLILGIMEWKPCTPYKKSLIISTKAEYDSKIVQENWFDSHQESSHIALY